MKILFIHPSVELYGADKILLYILELLHKDNDITVLVPKDGILLKKIHEISNDIKIDIDKNLPIVHSKLSKIELIKLPINVKKFQKKYNKYSFDLVYCNTLATTLLLYTNWAKKRCIHVHEIIENKILNIGFSFLIKKSDNVICVSNHVRENLLSSKKYNVIYNGIPDLNNSEINNVVNDKIKFVLPGRFMQKKGQWFFIDAIRNLSKESLEKISVSFFGSAPPNRQELKDDLVEYINSNNLQNIVTLHSFTENINDIYESANVIVVPSLMADPFPTTVLEAMMYGKPVITTNHGGASEIVSTDFGYLVKPGDDKALAAAISDLIRCPEKINCMSIFARSKFKKDLTLDEFKKRFMEFYNIVCE